MSDLGGRIKEYRLKAGMTQEDLADKLILSRQAVSIWESGKSAPTKKRLQKIAEILGVPLEKLLEPKKDTEDKDYILPEGATPLGDTVVVPLVSEEMTACLGSGRSAMDITSESERVFLEERSQFRVLDSIRMPYSLVCHGDCLESVGIKDGFAVVVNPAEMPSNGNLALVSMNGLLSVKFFSRRLNGDVILSSDNGTIRLTPQEQEETELGIEGAVVSWHPVRRPTKFL